MKILIVSSYLPYPLFSGGHIRLYNLLKNLKDKHEITLVCEKREYQTQSDIDRVKEVVKDVITVDRRQQWSGTNILKSAFSMKPFLIVGHDNREMKDVIKELLEREVFDLIHVETFYVYQNLPKTKIPVVLVEHNIEYLVYKRYADKASFLLKPFLYWDVFKLKNSEKSFWKKANKLVAVSRSEKNLMKRPDTEVVPNGVDIQSFRINKRKNKREHKRVLFIGDFKWMQNRDSTMWIIKNVWPKVIEKSSSNLSPILWVVGKKIPSYLKGLKDNTIEFDENASSQTQLIFQDADILLAPIRIGGGTSFKILEAMACGLPVLTTELGNEGIDAQSGTQIIVCETADEFSNNTIDILENEKKYREISENARKYIEGKFDWVSISRKLDRIYKEAVAK